jgi:hypothetical protein
MFSKSHAKPTFEGLPREQCLGSAHRFPPKLFTSRLLRMKASEPFACRELPAPSQERIIVSTSMQQWVNFPTMGLSPYASYSYLLAP